MDSRIYESSSDSEGTARNDPRQPFIHPSDSRFLPIPSRRSFTSLASASSSPLPSRSNSPLPELYPLNQSSSCPSESDSDSDHGSSHLLDMVNRHALWRDNRRVWWSSTTRRRRKKGWGIVRSLKKWLKWLVRLPFFPSQPITIVRYQLAISHQTY